MTEKFKARRRGLCCRCRRKKKRKNLERNKEIAKVGKKLKQRIKYKPEKENCKKKICFFLNVKKLNVNDVKEERKDYVLKR